jgi:hypothetical protein
VPILSLVGCGLAKAGQCDMWLAEDALVVGEPRLKTLGQRLSIQPPPFP